MDKTAVQLKKGRKVALWAALITLLLAGLKGLIGYYFNSDVLIADAFHSGADTIAIFASAFGLWIASSKKNRRFPYGLFKAETFVTFIIGCFICWAGIELILQGYSTFSSVQNVIAFPYLPVAVSIFSIIVAYLIAKIEKRVGVEVNSHSLIANAQESFLDIISSVVVLIGIVMSYWKIPYIEGVIIIIIGILIVKLGLENTWNSFLVLLDANLDEKLQNEILEIAESVPGVEQVSDIKIRQAGPFRMVELEFMANPSISLYHSHDIGNEIESLIKNRYNSIESVFIHTEPSQNKDIKAIIPVSEVDGLSSKIYGHFGRAPFFASIRISNGNYEVEDFFLNEFLGKKIHIGLSVVNVIIKYDYNMIFTSQIGEIAFYKLRDNYIDIYKVGESDLTIDEGLKHYLENKLTRIKAPTHYANESIVENI